MEESFVIDAEALLNFLFDSMKNSPSKTETFEKLHQWISQSSITDEIKMILLSKHSLNSFQSHLNIWNPEKPLKAIVKNLQLMLLLSDKMPELQYSVLSESGYLKKVLSIHFDCLRYLTERNQREIDENIALSLVFSYVCKYATKVCLEDKKDEKTFPSGQLYFKQVLLFLRCQSEFAQNPNNCVYMLTLANMLNSIMTKVSAYKSLFVKLKGIEYCLSWLSKSYKDRRNFFQKLYFDLRILSILEDFIDDPYFATLGRRVGMQLIKYLRYKGELILCSTFMKESFLVFHCVCSILIKMTMKIGGFREYINTLGVRLLLLSFLNKDRTCAKAAYTALLVLEEIDEAVDDSGIMDICSVMSRCERHSNILLLSDSYRIHLLNDIN